MNLTMLSAILPVLLLAIGTLANPTTVKPEAETSTQHVSRNVETTVVAPHHVKTTTEEDFLAEDSDDDLLPNLEDDTKHIANALKLLALLEEEEKAEEEEEAELEEENYEEFLLTLLSSMDKRNPFVLHKDKILGLSNKQKQAAIKLLASSSSTASSSTSDKTTTTSSSSIVASSSSASSQSTTENAKLDGSEQKVGTLLRTGLNPKAAALVASPEQIVPVTQDNSSSASSKMMIFGIVSSIIALMLSIVSIAGICWVVYFRRKPNKQLPLLSPKFPLFSPKEGLSTIYRNRKFKIPKKTKREAEVFRQTCEREEEFRRQKEELELKSPEVDEMHFGANDFLNASLSSI